MPTIVTGASGAYGRLAAEGLLARLPPGEVILVSRRPEKLADLASRGAIVRQGDFDDPAPLPAAFAGGTTMLLISTGRVGKRVAQHRAAIDAAVAAGVSRIAYTSFIGISPDNPAIVTADHGATEDLIKASGAAWTLLRDSQYADAMIEAAAPNALASGQWMASAGDGKVSFITRRDCAACAVEALAGEGHANKTYEITGPELLSLRDVARIVSEVAGKQVEFTPVTDEGMYAFFDSLGVPREPVDDQVVAEIPWCSNDMVSFERAIREGWLAVLSDDARRLLGRTPQSFRSFAEERAPQLRAAAAQRP
jgi:NAD(P)H dehydrogenase (quinone)